MVVILKGGVFDVVEKEVYVGETVCQFESIGV